MYKSSKEALEAAQAALTYANKLALEEGALPEMATRREIDRKLLEYQKAISAHALLTRREAEQERRAATVAEREHSRRVGS